MGHPFVWLSGVIALGVILYLVRGQSSAEAKARRRLRRSHRPVISRQRGPTIRLAVNLDKPKWDKER